MCYHDGSHEKGHCMEKTKQLKLNIKGNFKNLLNKWFLERKIKKFGVNVHKIEDLSSTNIEILLSGEKNKLWDVVNWSKDASIFVFLNEVIFEFDDVVPQPRLS